MFTVVGWCHIDTGIYGFYILWLKLTSFVSYIVTFTDISTVVL